MGIVVKKLSEYSALDGLQVLGKLTRAISPYAKNKALIESLQKHFKSSHKDDLRLSGAIIFMDCIETITESAPGLIFEVVAIMSDSDKKTIEEANLLNVIDAVMSLSEDEALKHFLSKRFSLSAKESLSTSTTTEGKV